MSEHVPTALKRLVAARARNCCEYCRSREDHSAVSFSVEHVVPRVGGGATTLENLAFACQACNNHKHAQTKALDPLSRQWVPLFNPRRQRWPDHFKWNDDASRVVGRTAIGRAAVMKLRLNRPGLIRQRNVMARAGQHPPPPFRQRS